MESPYSYACYGILLQKEKLVYSGYFNFRYLRKVYMYILCRKMKDISHIVSYISRYVSHPPISEKRITEINEEYNTVTYYYTPHEDETKTVTVTEDLFEFIKKLIIHIPEKGFKQIRYYGLYASAYKKRKKIHITEMKTWRSRIFRDFHIDLYSAAVGTI